MVFWRNSPEGRAKEAAYQAAYALLPEVIAAKEARRVASMEETARRYLEVDANVALLSRPEAQHLGEQLFTEQEFEVLNNATMKRAFEDKTHCVLITKLEKEKEDRAWFTKRGGGRPALLWKRTPKAYISPTHAFERLGFQSETVMWLTTRRSARLLEESLQALCLEAAPFGIVTNRKAGVGAYLDKRDDDGDGNFAFVQSEPGGAEEQRLRQLQLGDGGGRGENGWVYVNH
ncbi:hypothetical protein T484DRAFT_1766226 [Baffinella frigidus]|nr:hypothetical protein T484DRAFT_1766226 [Cryptophyta sp. CCMP2293]